MEYAEVLSKSEIGAVGLQLVTPQVLPLPTVRYASSAWGRFVLLSTLFHDERRGKDLCTLWRFDPSDGSWKVLHEEIQDMPARKEGVADPAHMTGIQLSPDPTTKGEIADVWWDLRGGVRRVRVRSDEEAVSTPPPDSAADIVFVSWHWMDGALIAMVEEPDGRRRLMRRSEEEDGRWDAIPAPGDSDRISGFTVFDGAVFVTIDDARRGFGLWKLPTVEGPVTTDSWQPVLELGAFRYLLNGNVLELASCEDALYLAVGLKTALPVDQSVGAVVRHDFELLRVYPGGKEWDVVIGQPRFTVDGLKVPLSGRGPGFDERDPLWVACLVNSASALHLGVADNEMAQLWRLDGADQWKEACHGAFMEYQHARLITAYPTSHGLLLITECLDFSGNGKLELWMLPL